MKILNLYACLGGNRYLWGDDHEITAVELDPELARLYQERFPNDKVIIGDAHQYLLDHYKEFDFIWSSPPCPTHSRARFWTSAGYSSKRFAVYPDMSLYQEILLLKHYFKGKYVVENVIPFYDPLIPPQKRGRHLYWTNFDLPEDIGERRFRMTQTKNEVTELCKFHKIDLSTYKGDQRKDKIARNLVDYISGNAIFEAAQNNDYDEGLRIGEIIENKFLLTMEIDSLRTKNIINLEPDDVKENRRLHDRWEETIDFGKDNSDNKLFYQWRDHLYEMGEKYLPKKLECKVKPNSIGDITLFKKGLRDFLWDTDLSWYMPEDDFFSRETKGVVLTRSDKP